MARTTPFPRYVIVSPVKDEERYVDLTLRSVTRQTLKPVLWVIVNDGSTDRTAEIVGPYAAEHPFIRLIDNPNSGARQPGAAVIHAFNRGHASLREEDYDFIVKLDCDLSFEPEYFEKLLEQFMSDERLGIASGVYLDVDKVHSWKPVKMPSYHAFGACKVVRRRCFAEIGGFLEARGWDTVDEIRALSLGWKTRHFETLKVRHHKPEGSGIGFLRTSKMHGEIYYTTGGDPLFLFFKILRRMVVPPFLVNGLALLLGYCGAVLCRTPRLVTPSEAQCYRRLLRRRLFKATKSPVALSAIHSRR